MSLFSRLRSLLFPAQNRQLAAWIKQDQTTKRQPTPPFALVTELVKPHYVDVFTPKVAPGAGKPHGSRFCGPALLAAGESWPTCGKCRANLQLFLQLNSQDLSEEAGRPFGEGILQLFYCADEQCDGDYVPFASTYRARILPTSASLTLHTRPGTDTFPPKSITGWDSDIDLPNAEELSSLGIALTDEQSEAIHESETASYPRQGDKLLGWPDWVQSVEYVQCSRCQKKMKYIFQLASEDNIPYMFGDCGVGHISICPDHPDIIAFTWACC